jgi:beta-lactamase class A
LILFGIGLGVLSGTALKLLAPQVRQQTVPELPWLSDLIALTGDDQPEEKETTATTGSSPSEEQPIAPALLPGQFLPKQEITALSQRWVQLAAAQADLEASAFLLVLDDGRYAQMQADRAMPAASSIKTPILLVSLEQIDRGDLRWNEPLTLTKPVVGGGAGWMASKPLGTRFPTYEVATEMIRISDNTATNLLIERAGGKDRLNSRFQALGLTATKVNNWLPDLDGTNTTSARDLSRAIALVDIGDTLSLRTRDLFRDVMGTSVTNTLIPKGLMQGLGGEQGRPDPALSRKGYRVYNKTGDIGIAYADAGLIELPDGRRAVAGFLVKGPFNDPRSTSLIRAMAAAMAPHLKPAPSPPRDASAQPSP